MLDKKKLYEWCCIPAEKLLDHPDRRIELRILPDAKALGELMALDFAEDIEKANKEGRKYHAIVPCGPKDWYGPFARIINQRRISLKNVVCFHMDENLDWQGRLLHEKDPNNFRTFMHEFFYEAIDPGLQVPTENRHYLLPETYMEIARRIGETDIDYCLGGWGQDGHLAFNLARRNHYSPITLEEMRNSTARIQDNNPDTVLALSQRGLGTAWQFMPPMSITLGVKECLKAKKVRVYSATGAWKQTALRVALFSEPTADFPITLLQEHPDAIMSATEETARHPFAENPHWRFNGVNDEV